MPAGGDLIEALSGVEGCAVAENVPLSGLTTWKVGGQAKLVIRADTMPALTEVLRMLRESRTRSFVLGNGSNVLVADTGYEGAVLRLKGEFSEVAVDGETVFAGAGAMLSAAMKAAVGATLSGLEFAAGIPGTVGGAAMTNAGTFAGCMSDAVIEVRAMSPDGKAVTLTEFADAYRQPLVAGGLVVASVRFRLAMACDREIEEKTAGVRARRANQPVGAATAGSVFRNPPGDSAGRLLDECGFKGRVVGGAQVSPLHANFIVNQGGASARDIKALMDEMAFEVRDRFSVELQPEVTLVGFEEER